MSCQTSTQYGTSISILIHYWYSLRKCQNVFHLELRILYFHWGNLCSWKTLQFGSLLKLLRCKRWKTLETKTSQMIPGALKIILTCSHKYYVKILEEGYEVVGQVLFTFFKIRKRQDITGVQCLQCQASAAGGTGSIPGQGTKTPHAAWPKKKKDRKKKKVIQTYHGYDCESSEVS